MGHKTESLIERMVDNVERLIDLICSWLNRKVHVHTCGNTLPSVGFRPENRRVQSTPLPQKYQKLAEAGVPVYELPVKFTKAMIRDISARSRIEIPHQLLDALKANAVDSDVLVPTRWYTERDESTLSLESAIVFLAYRAHGRLLPGRTGMRVSVKTGHLRGSRGLSIETMHSGRRVFKFE